MENGQPEEVGRAQGCWRCYRWFPGRTPRTAPGEGVEMAESREQAAQQAEDEQQEVAPAAAENLQPMIEPQQPINPEEAANVENPRQPEEAESARGDCCFPCFLPQQEISPSVQGAAPQAVNEQPEDVPVAVVNLQPIGGSDQSINQEDEDFLEEMEPGCPIENHKPFLVFSFVLLFFLCVGQALHIMSYELGWRGNGTDNAHASTETNFNVTTESNMIFDRTPAIAM